MADTNDADNVPPSSKRRHTQAVESADFVVVPVAASGRIADQSQIGTIAPHRDDANRHEVNKQILEALKTQNSLLTLVWEAL